MPSVLLAQCPSPHAPSEMAVRGSWCGVLVWKRFVGKRYVAVIT